MSGEYISREAAIEAIGSLLRQHFLCVPDSPTQAAATAGYMDGVKDGDIRLRSIPAADVVEVRHGRWEQVEILHVEDLNEEDKNCILIASMFCPECKRYHNEVYLYGSPTEMVRYCPNCGAKMDGSDKNA